MALRIGIVGLPNVGKSTLFNALTKTRSAQAANYPFCTIDPNIGIVEVPDKRIGALVAIDKPEKVIPAAVEFVDIAGLVKGASKGEGLGNAFLSHIREVHAVCHVVRAFKGGDVIHVDGTVEPKRDRETIETELALADLVTMEKRIEKLEGKVRTGDKQAAIELSALKKLETALQAGKPASTVPLSPEESVFAKDFQLLTQKPMVYAVNVAEDQVKTYTAEQAHAELGLPADADVVVICAKVEEDLQELSEEEAKEYLKELSLDSSGLDRLIHAAYHALGYITFFTAGADEVRAWTVTRGATAPQAAGVIHTDFEKGFIRAETIAYDDYVKYGGEAGAREAGKMRAEGKEYIVKDGDIFNFRFNV
jgi:GTP-binding protein YchF